MSIKLFAATKAFIVHDGRVLILRESNKYVDGSKAGQYDFPGGRVEPGQHFLDSLRREIDEETGLDCEIGQPFAANEWRPVVRGEQWQIIASFFLCHSNSKQVRLSADHDDYKWIDPADYRDHDIIPTNHAAFEAYLKLRH